MFDFKQFIERTWYHYHVGRNSVIKKLCTANYILLAVLILLPTITFAKSPPPGTGAADVPANILLMLDTSGSMDTVINEGSLYYPVDLDFDSSGNAYVAVYYDKIIKFDATGAKIDEFGGYGDDDGEFNVTFSIDVEGSYMYVSDHRNGRVQKLRTSDGEHITTYDNSGRARGVAVDSDGYVYVVNGDARVQKFNNSGSLISTWSNSYGRYIAIDGDDVYVTNFNGRKIERYNKSGSLQSSINLSFYPYGIEIGADGDIYVSDYYDGEIHRYETDGTYVESFGSEGYGDGEFKYPRGIVKRPSDDKIFVANYYNHRIQALDEETIFDDESPQSRLDVLKNVTEAIMTDSALTSGANFGMMQWNSSANMEVEVSESGAAEIFNTVGSLTAGGSTYLDNAMDLADSYFRGSDSPIDPDTSCQQNILIVLSDGFWVDSTASDTAESLYNDLDIETFVVGFQTTGNDNYVTLSTKGGTYPDSPLYADNEENLLSVLSSYIRQVISSQLTFSTPTIIPGVTNEDSIMQSTFVYKGDGQWKGHFIKYALQSDGNIGSAIWNAGDVLNATNADSRNLWTVAEGLEESTNNFITTNRIRLRPLIEEDAGTSYTDTEIDDLIEFTRGKDSYNEFPTGFDDEGTALISGERWKLADIYHSRAVVVGVPSAYSSDAARPETEAYFRYQNSYDSFKTSSDCGGDCDERDEVIYVGSNGGMLHAFDSATGSEKWGFIPPSVVPNLKNMIGLSDGESVSIYGVDGSPIVKDVYIDDAWRTVLVSGLRQGGNSYFALDVTDADNPTHMFTYDVDQLNDVVSYWDADGVRTDYNFADGVPSDYDVSELGESWSDPVIVHIPYGSDGKWVSIIGGGYNNGIDSAQGAVVYILDLEDGGKILQKIALGDSDGTNDIVTSVPPRLNVIIPDDTPYLTSEGALAYVADLEGKLWKINLTDSGTLFEATRLFESEATADNDRMVYHETTASISADGYLMQFFGTGDMQGVGRIDANIQNRAYAIFDRVFPSFVAQGSPHLTNDLFDATDNPSSCPTIDDEGWYIDLDANERITARVSIKNSTLFLPRYTPDGDDLCAPGNAVLSEHEYSCGAMVRETNLGAGMPTEITLYKNKVYIGISSDVDADDDLPEGFTKQGNLIVGSPANPAPSDVQIEFWREMY